MHLEPSGVESEGSAQPVARRLDLFDDLFGHRVADPYRWLEDADCEETLSWTSAQDDLFAEHAATWPGRDAFAERVGQLMRTGAVGVPIWRGERCFTMRRNPDQEHAVLLVSEVTDDGTRRERVLIDPMQLDPHGTTTLDGWQPSKEGDRLAFQLSAGGTEESQLRVMDVASGEIIDGPIDRVRYSPVAWLPGGDAYYYVRRLAPDLVPADEQQYHRRVWLHRVGTDPDGNGANSGADGASGDVEIFGAGHDLRSYYGVSVSRGGDWLIISRSTGTAPRNDLWIAPLSPDELGSPALREIQVGVDAQTSAYVGRDGRLYISTDRDAPRGRFAVTDPANPGAETWQTLLGAGGPDDGGPDAVLEDVAICDGPDLDEPRLVAAWRRHAVSELSVHRPDGVRLPGEAGAIGLAGPGSVGGLVERYDGGPVIWFSYTDHTMPGHVFAFDARTGALTQESAPPGVVPLGFEVESRQVAYTSADGTTVHMFVLHRADSKGSTDDAGPAHSEPMPTILYGYGGFGISMTPAYSAQVLTWLEAGGVYAIAGLRGGGEEGEQWHRDGMLANKHHVFEDFEAAAMWLIDNGVSTPDKLCISGGSNGGLLVGAALTRRPDLYAAVVCSAPLLDMVRYERFGLGSTWNVEYGSAEVPQELEWLLSYSPYHHVHEGTAYPATLFTVFDGDTRVDTLHARKMCAALQHATTSPRSGSPVLMRLERDAGHGARSVSRSIALAADTLAFAARHTGLAQRQEISGRS